MLADQYDSDWVRTAPLTLTDKQATHEKIAGDGHCAFISVSRCLRYERKLKADGTEWDAGSLRQLTKQLINNHMQHQPSADDDQQSLLQSEGRSCWALLVHQLCFDTSDFDKELIFGSINSSELVYQTGSRTALDLERSKVVIARAYAEAICGGVAGAEALWAGDFELTLLAQHFKLRIATYVSNPIKVPIQEPARQLRGHALTTVPATQIVRTWTHMREYIAHDAEGPLHKLLFQNQNHYNYVRPNN